jgi:hypothetical protein
MFTEAIIDSAQADTTTSHSFSFVNTSAVNIYTLGAAVIILIILYFTGNIK